MRKTGPTLVLLLLVGGCSGMCGKGGTVATPAGSAATVARVLAICDTASNGIPMKITGVSADNGGETHAINTTGYLTNPTATSITWATDTIDAGGAIKGVSGNGNVVTVPDSVGEVWQVDATVTVGGKTMTITGRVRKNPTPPPPCTASGTWSIPNIGNGTWSF